jgi:RNA polymerase sigma factor for flagellar operon FliA
MDGKPNAATVGAQPVSGLAAARPGQREERLVREGLPALKAEALRLWRRLGRRVELDELEALGHAALVEVARTFDEERASFETYARLKLRWAMLDGLRRQTHGRVAAGRARALAGSDQLWREGQQRPGLIGGPPDAESAGRRLGTFLRAHAGALAMGLIAAQGDLAALPHPGESPEDGTLRRAASRRLRAMVRELPKRERALVEGHYFEEQRFDHIAKRLGITKSWASRLHARAIRTLAARLAEPS